jgi:sulfite reductase alpha subunit-like flavoprotein
MPKNTTKFWKNLRREKLSNTNCLGPVRFTIFGLGDSSYLKYVAKTRSLCGLEDLSPDPNLPPGSARFIFWHALPV